MPTEVQKLYNGFRADGLKDFAALREVAFVLGVDVRTMKRVLDRANKEAPEGALDDAPPRQRREAERYGRRSERRAA
jgi:hypothetical protein